jgi:hypothetical protein
MSLELVELSTGCLFESGFRSLEAELAGIRRRIARGRERADDRADLEACELALAELRALYRASLRAALELGEEAAPLDRALIDVEELILDDLTLRTIAPETRDALKREREADYALVLFGLADSGPLSVST